MISPDPQSSAAPEWTVASGAAHESDPLELLDADRAAPENDFAAPALWQRLLRGEASPRLVRAVALQVYPVVGGRWSNALFAKISNLEFADGREVFRRLWERTRDAERHPEALWRRFALAAGCDGTELDLVLSGPLIEATGFIEQARWFGHRSGHEAAAVAYLVETGLPALWERLGVALADHYDFSRDDLAFFTSEAAELTSSRDFLAGLVRRYCDTDWKAYLGRRAAREVAWSWQVLAERIETLG